MAISKTEKIKSKKASRKNRAAEIADTFEWLITAFILAFFFRAFVMEAYRIPTGSMADTLKGAHFRLRCPQCGYKYDYGLGNYGLPRDSIPSGHLQPKSSRCPSCGHYQATGGAMPIANGDRILVLKCIYQFVEPKQWDVIVFKNPLDPQENYIKRLVGRPEETVEIIDGDIYIDGKISRKPPNVQNELWMTVYDNDYQPVRPAEPSFNGHTWQQPLKNTEGSKWEIDKDSPTVFRLDSPIDKINSLSYDTSRGNDFRATYAYDDVGKFNSMPYCSDLMVRFYVRPNGTQGRIGLSLSKYQARYKAWLDFTDKMVIEKVDENGKTTELARKPFKSPAVNKSVLVKFANVDHQLVFQVGREKLTYDLGPGPNGAGERRTNTQPKVKIFGSGKLTLSHVAIFRDIYYTQYQFGNSGGSGRATEGNSFNLEKDQFFVLGDNSPDSQDSRWWGQKGIGNNSRYYSKGIVPREYLVGKALLVYWPSGFNLPWPQSLKTLFFKKSRGSLPLRIMYAIASLNWIPNVGQMRFIYGGSGKRTQLFTQNSEYGGESK